MSGTTKPGIKPEWQNLPRRKCDNCGTPYRPIRPLKPDQHGFCQDNCRKEFHKRGGSFSKLKPVIIAEVRKRVRQLRPDSAEWIESIEKRIGRIEKTLESAQEAFNFRRSA